MGNTEQRQHHQEDQAEQKGRTLLLRRQPERHVHITHGNRFLRAIVVVNT